MGTKPPELKHPEVPSPRALWAIRNRAVHGPGLFTTGPDNGGVGGLEGGARPQALPAGWVDLGHGYSRQVAPDLFLQVRRAVSVERRVMHAWQIGHGDASPFRYADAGEAMRACDAAWAAGQGREVAARKTRGKRAKVAPDPRQTAFRFEE